MISQSADKYKAMMNKKSSRVDSGPQALRPSMPQSLGAGSTGSSTWTSNNQQQIQQQQFGSQGGIGYGGRGSQPGSRPGSGPMSGRTLGPQYGNGNNSRGGSPPSYQRNNSQPLITQAPPKPDAQAPTGMSKEVFQTKAKAALDELWHLQSTDTVEEDLKLFKKAGMEGVFIARLLHDGCSDKFFKPANLELGKKLIAVAHKEKTITQATVLDALGKIAKRWIEEDLFCDAPLCVDNLAKVMAGAVKSGVVTLKFFEEGFQPFVEMGQGKKAIRVLLQVLAKDIGEDELSSMYKNSQLNLRKLLGSREQTDRDVGDFLNQGKLLYLEPLLGLPSKITSLLEKVNEDAIDMKDIADVLSATPVTDDCVLSVTRCLCEYLTLVSYFGIKKFNKRQYDRMPVEERKEKKLQRPVEASLALEKSLLEEIKKLITDWVFASKKRVPAKTQLSVLYAFQEVAHAYDHPKGMLGNLFYVVYDWKFIEHETFDMWREAVNDDRYVGKQMALPTLSKFFQWYSTEDTVEADKEE